MGSVKKSERLFYPWQSWLIFIVASFFFLYEFVIQISPNVMSSELMQSFHVDAAGLGVISGAYYITYTLMQVPVGMLYDKFGPRKLLSLACFFCAIGAVIFGMTENIVAASVGRMFMGVGSAFAFTGCLFLVHRWFPPRYFALMAGCVMIMSAIGSIIGETPLAKAVELYGWRSTINFIAIIGFLLSVMIFIIVRDSPANSEFHDTEDHSGEMSRLREVLLNKQTWAVAFYAFTSWAPILTVPAFIGVLFVKSAYGVSTTSAASAMTMAWLGIAVGSPLLGWLSDRIQRRTILLSINSFLGFIAISLVVYLPSMGYAWLYLWLFIFGFAAGAQSLTFAVVKDNNPKHRVGTAMGVNNVLVVCGGFIFQPLVGFLLRLFWDGTVVDSVPIYKTLDFQYALAIVPACFAVGLILALFGIRETRCLPYEQRRMENEQHAREEVS